MSSAPHLRTNSGMAQYAHQNRSQISCTVAYWFRFAVTNNQTVTNIAIDLIEHTWRAQEKFFDFQGWIFQVFLVGK